MNIRHLQDHYNVPGILPWPSLFCALLSDCWWDRRRQEQICPPMAEVQSWKGYLCMFVLILSQWFPSDRKSLLFHTNEIEMVAGIVSQTTCPVFTSFLIRLKLVHINTMFSFSLNLHIVTCHIQIVELYFVYFYRSSNLDLVAPSLLIFISPPVLSPYKAILFSFWKKEAMGIS